MAVYKATPHYAVAINGKTVRFDWRGEYKTDDAAEVAVLDGLSPKWITKVVEASPKLERKVESEPESDSDRKAGRPASRSRK